MKRKLTAIVSVVALCLLASCSSHTPDYTSIPPTWMGHVPETTPVTTYVDTTSGLFGVPDTSSEEQPPVSSENCVGCAPITTGVVPSTAADEEISDDEAKAVMNYMLASIGDFWTATYKVAFPKVGTSDALAAFAAPNEQMACGTEARSGSDGPAYCILNDTMIAPVQVMKDAASKGLLLANGDTIDAAGAIGVFFLLAHEWGHNVTVEISADHGGLAALQKVPGVEQENFADCAAGMAIAGADIEFNQADADAVLKFAEQAGDATGVGHGTPAQRKAALTMGMNHTYGDWQGFSDGLFDCIAAQAPTLAQLLKG